MSISRVHKVLDIELPTTEKMILVLLADNANDESGECWPSQGYLAKRSGMTRTNVNLVINRLRDKGHIKVDHRYRDDGGQRANVYTVLPGYLKPQGGVKLVNTESVSNESIQKAEPEVPCDVWKIWFAIGGTKPLLGRAIKKYGESDVAQAIGSVLLKNPAVPDQYLMGVLKSGKKKRGFVA